MKRIIRNFSIVLTITTMVFMSCKDEEPDPELSVSPTTTAIVFAADGKSATAGGTTISPTFTVTTNQESWDASSNQSWLHVKKSGDTFTLSADANTNTSESAPATVTVTAGDAKSVTISVTQMGANPFLSISPEKITTIVFAADGASATSDNKPITPTFTVTTNVSAWEAVSNQSWLHVEKSDNTFTLTADANTSLDAPEPATVTVTAGEATPLSITVNQLPSPPLLEVSSTDEVIFSIDGKSAISNGVAFTPVFTVTTNYPTWNVISDQSWLTVEKEENKFTLSANANMFVNELSATVTVTAGEGASISIDIKQEGNLAGVPTYAISTQVWEIKSADQTIKQKWSDYIEYDGNNKAADGTLSTFDGEYRDAAPGYRGYLYSWYYVTDHANKLCPSPWRVPTKEDLINLDKALGGTGENVTFVPDHLANYATKWKVSYGGHVKGDGTLQYQGAYHYIWTSSSFNDEKAYYQLLTNEGNVSPQANTSSTGKAGGRPVRCVCELE
ncbi:BACON domain-containing protein [Proteiniphilum sp.]|uniref:BACON domain-containing protein n=1 Tax=Proteiniphilum sp. TaxID=1926877 RepID=UPI002B1F5F54|nr:BACON domain-containing carbohydrate-binding protein [Proteiniphilum sp.]MEA4917216.1 BACON domain-containing carbohydrate-binding protein [Proteiniphilum sp.]